MPQEPTTEPSLSARLRLFAASFDVTAALLALLLAAFMVVGASFDATDSTAWFTSSWGAAVGSALAAVAIAVVLAAPILSTDSPFSGRGGDDQRAVSVLEAEVDQLIGRFTLASHSRL